MVESAEPDRGIKAEAAHEPDLSGLPTLETAPLLDLSTRAPTLDPVRMYLAKIGRVALLTRAQEVALAKRIERHDMAAKRR